MTFKEFLEKRRVTYDEYGDFAAEALERHDLTSVSTWSELEAEISKTNTFRGVEAAKAVWRAYQEQALKMMKRKA